MLPIPRFRGPAKYRLRCAEIVARSVVHATARRLSRGPRMKDWNWTVELGTAIIRNHLRASFKLANAGEQRRFLDSMVLEGPAGKLLETRAVEEAGVRGRWIRSNHATARTLLYLHGGGFAVYPQDSYTNLIALITLAAKSDTFAPDYPLAPEHPFPAALEDVRNAYLWLLRNGVDAKHLVVAGDSAGGNLTLALLCDLRDRGMPLPALAIALSPATEFDTIRPSMTANDYSDWIAGEYALTWRDWYCRPEERSNPLISPIHAELRGLPPIYMQAGRAEILYDSVVAFAEEAARQGADVTLDAWDDMNHVFQFFGYDAPQSSEALRRITEVIDQHLPLL